MLKKLALCALITVAAAASSGCFLRFALGATVVESLTEEIDQIITALFARATTGVCRQDLLGAVDCVYVLDGEELPSRTRLISEFGLFGVLVDPIVLEVPADVRGLSGTYSGGGNSGSLLVYPNLSYVPIDDNRSLTPAPGKQLVILDLPPGVPVDGVDYDFSISFSQIAPAGSGPTPFKAIATGKVQVLGKSFYPPIFPCVDSFTEVPEIQAPASATPQPLTVPSGLSGCAEKLYVYFSVPRACDLDNDRDVDAADVNLIMNVRNMPAAEGDPRDINGDGTVNANDARVCSTGCTRNRCAQ